MVFRSPIFRKLLSAAFVLIALTLAVLDFNLARYTTKHEVQAIEQRLTPVAMVLTTEAASLPPERLEEWSKSAAARAHCRITVIDPQGVVLAESEQDPAQMENHANRPEIQEAYLNRVGSAIRHSATLGGDLCYLAVPLQFQGRRGYVLRVALPIENLDAAIAEVRWRILTASAVAALVALFIAYFFSRSFTRRIGRLRAFAEGLAKANFTESPLPDADDELGSLTRSLNSTASQLHDLIERLGLESERREAILTSMVEGVLAVDQDLRITFYNASFARVLGLRSEVPAKAPLVDIVRDPVLREILSRVVAGGETLKQRLQLPAAEGRAFEVQAAPLRVATGRGAIAILHDITDLERLERVRKDFVANVSHELRTPLTAIRGYTETLLEGALEDKDNNRKFLEIIKNHSVRLNSIASDLLALSELESGKASTEQARVAVRPALEAALRAVEDEARSRRVKLISGQMEDVEVLGDRVRMEQAFVNLLTNAVKFNRPEGEVRVEVLRTRDDEVSITIADNGIGIPSADLPRLFERFYRVDKARSREMGGTGLGLSIVKHIVDRMRGRITVESQLGKGSVFTVLLPAA
ncbi:MAG: ATP-binding protein [Terriglobia bacterium]|jgi:two-component system phosphate regulon sensor histidine kinase PhoR